MKKILWLFAAALLLLGACSSGNDGAEGINEENNFDEELEEAMEFDDEDDMGESDEPSTDDKDEYVVELNVQNKTDDTIYLKAGSNEVDSVSSDDYASLEETLEPDEVKEGRYVLENRDGIMSPDDGELYPTDSIQFDISVFEGDSDDGEHLNSYTLELKDITVGS